MIDSLSVNKGSASACVFSGSGREEKKRIVCVDDHKILLEQMLSYVRELLPDAEVVGFERKEEALAFSAGGCDVLFTEIELYGQPAGLELARAVQRSNPRVNIVFATVCSQNEYAKEVVELRPSAYLTKVVTKKDVQSALQNLLYKTE